jgi:hypothetical protein
VGSRGDYPIILDAEGIPAGKEVHGFYYKGRTESDVSFHTQILIEEGTLDGVWRSQDHHCPQFIRVSDLTYRGYQFLEHARSDDHRQRALLSVQQSGQVTSIDAIEVALDQASL